MSYEVTWEPRGVIKRFSALVTDNEMIQSVVDTEKDARFDELRYVINDFLGITGISMTKDSVEEISVHPEIIALANAYANSLLNAYPIKIFPTLVEARSWLGQENPHR